MTKSTRRFDMDSITKKCAKCGEWKNKSDFYKNKARKSGLSEQCKACVLDRQTIYAEQHREQERQRAQKWREDNPEKNLEMKRKYRNAHLEDERQRTRNWVQINLDRVKELNKRWYKEHQEWVIEKHHRRRAREKNGGNFTADEWREVKEKYNHTCLRCGKMEPEIKLTPDHVLPLSKGGLNVIENIQPLCFSCNSSKRAKHIDYRTSTIG
jgi:5-methylcytosine-specific restriction endonuclease McrA